MTPRHRPEVDIQTIEAEILGPAERRRNEETPPPPSPEALVRQWRETAAREIWRAARLCAD